MINDTDDHGDTGIEGFWLQVHNFFLIIFFKLYFCEISNLFLFSKRLWIIVKLLEPLYKFMIDQF